jgi:hypothetical protein
MSFCSRFPLHLFIAPLFHATAVACIGSLICVAPRVQVEDKDVRYCHCDEVAALIRTLGPTVTFAVHDNSAVQTLKELSEKALVDPTDDVTPSGRSSVATGSKLTLPPELLSFKNANSPSFDLTGKGGVGGAGGARPAPSVGAAGTLLPPATRAQSNMSDDDIDAPDLYLPSVMVAFGEEDRVFKNPLFAKSEDPAADAA